MVWIVTILLGALAGWLASVVTKRDAEQGWLGNILVGIGGALLSKFIISNGNLDPAITGFWDLVWAFLGALVLCLLLNYFTRYRIR